MTVIPGEEQAVRGGGPKPKNQYDAPFRHNPGTRVRFMPLAGYTQPGLIDGGLVLPAPPLNSLQRSLTNNWADYDTVSAGQFSRPSGMQLQTISIDSIVVTDDYPWVFYNPSRHGLTVDDLVAQLGKLLRSSTPFWLYLENAEYKSNNSGDLSSATYDFGVTPLLKMMATLRQLTPSIESGEPEARYITMGFTEHRIPGLTEKKLGQVGKGGDASALPAYIGAAVFSGLAGGTSAKSLQDLAIAYYGSAAKWKVILDANKWLGNVTATHDLGNLNTAELKAAAKANRQLKIPKAS